MIPVTCDPEGKLDRVPLDELEEYQGNLKSLGKTEYAKLKQSITEKGFIVPCFAWRNGSDKWKLLDGHQRIRVIRNEGWEIEGGIPIVEIAATDERDAKEKLLAIVSRYGRVEGQGLYEFLDGTGIDLEQWAVPDLPDLDLDSWLDEFMRDPAALGDPEAVPEVPEEPTTQLGDLWVLGDHRVLCGDATSVDDVERVMNDCQISACISDPPYGMDYTGLDGPPQKGMARKSRNAVDPIIGDSDPFNPMVAVELCGIAEVFLWGGDWFYNCLPPNGSWIVWDKRASVDADAIPGAPFEVCWSRKRRAREFIRIPWGGWNNKESFEQDRFHPTQKPVEVMSFLIEKIDGDVYDPFLGSGTTLIAAEKQGRRCFGLEIEPKYVDVIVKRWEDYTGKTAVLEQSKAA